MADILSDISKFNVRLESLSETRTQLLLELEHIESQIKYESAKRARLLNQLIPLWKLPPELLSSIFLVCQETKQSFPVIASHVCSHWRDVAIGTPLLWTNIRVSLNMRSLPSHLPMHVDRVEAYLARSGTSHFKVRIEVNGNHDFRKILDLIAAHIKRCVHIYFSAYHSYAPRIIKDCFNKLEAPVLEYLSINVMPWTHSEDYNTIQFDVVQPTIFTGILGAPSLSFLRVTGGAGSLQPPLTNITTLHIDGTRMDDLTLLQYRNLLVALPSLVNLSLLEIGIDDSSSEPLVPIPLPCLRSLRLRNSLIMSESVRFLLGCLPVEQLESVILSRVDNLYSTVFPRVQALIFCDCDFDVEQLGHLMLAFPVVKSFVIEGASTQLVLIALGYPGSPVWWPCLRTLTIREIQPNEATYLIEMVRNRKNMEHPLAKVFLDKRTRVVLRGRGELEEFGELVPVERHDDTEPWPSGLGYEDEDDEFWSP